MHDETVSLHDAHTDANVTGAFHWTPEDFQQPTPSPTAAELDAEYQQALADARRDADAAGVEYGYSYRTYKGFTGFADVPGEERAYCEGCYPLMVDASEAGILLAGRLARELVVAGRVA